MTILTGSTPSSVATASGQRQPLVGLPPGPSMPPMLQAYRWLRDPPKFLEECAQRFGDIFTIRLAGPSPWVLVWSPSLVKALFTASPDVVHGGEANATMFGPIAGDASVFTLDESAHLNRRRLLLPQFHGDRMQVYFDQIREIAMQTIAQWPREVPFALNRHTQQMALHAMIRAVLGVQTDRGDTEDRALVQVLTEISDDVAVSPLLLLPRLQRDWGPWSPWGRVVRILRRADDAIFRGIARRRLATDVADRQDILSLLLHVRYDDGSFLTDRQIRDELVVMLMAGHHTTAIALAWAFERILSHPAVEQGIRQELEGVVGVGPLTAEHLPRLEYLDATIKESLRNRPIGLAGGARLVRGAFEIGGYVIPPGSIVANAVYLLHRRPELYPEPDTFRPERFLGKRAIDPYEWTPFGGGMRRCLGYAFALFEMKAILATILSQVRLRIENPHAAAQRRGLFLAPTHGPRVVRIA